MTGTGGVGLRLDKWLWYTRFFKTRGLATAAVRGGHVRLNGERARPGARINVGDRLHIVRDQLRYELTVLGLPSRRGPASEARSCYQEDDASVRAREARLLELRSDRLQMPVTRGRPDKRTQRALRSRNRSPDS
jgi:ribosome-associated heat shock protein Hsp15